jgi:lysyl-tRNA synthetase class 2
VSELSELEQQRLEKSNRLRARGVEPYPHRAERTHSAAEALAAFVAVEAEGVTPQVTVVGRIVGGMREMGKAAFTHLEDGSGRLQLYIRLDELGQEAFEHFRKDYDISDFVQATGSVFRTRSGEITLRVRALRMLAKALHPLPEKWHGLKDVETRYRQRYADLIANPEVREVFVTRARIISAMRRFLDAHGFLEVETPVLQPVYGGAAARPFVTHHNQLHQDLYLRISFELYLKRLLVGGYERVYEIGRDFRNEGVSFKHNPEFTQMEFYWAYKDYNDTAALVEQMISSIAQDVLGTQRITYQGHEIDLTPPWQRMTLRDAIRQFAEIDYVEHPDAASLAQAIRQHGGHGDPKASWGKLVDGLLGDAVEPRLIQPTFLLDYPRDISPLAKMKPGDPSHVERFEAFIGGMEMGNAFTEINDPLDQEERFLEMGRAYAPDDEEAHPLDEDYLRAMRYGMPPNSGFGVGVDRLTMLLADKPTIREVLLFPHLRASGA